MKKLILLLGVLFLSLSPSVFSVDNKAQQQDADKLQHFIDRDIKGCRGLIIAVEPSRDPGEGDYLLNCFNTVTKEQTIYLCNEKNRLSLDTYLKLSMNELSPKYFEAQLQRVHEEIESLKKLQAEYEDYIKKHPEANKK